MSRRATAIALLVLVLLAAGAAAAYAHTVTGTQNPQLRVTVSIRPVHATAGETIVATETIVNTTKRTLNVTWGMEWDTPTSGLGSVGAGKVGPGVIDHQVFRSKVTATSVKGAFTISAHASDHRGGSHAATRATSH